MNLIEEQIVKINELTWVPRTKVLVLIIGNASYNAINGLREQLYTNFEVAVIECNNFKWRESEKDFLYTANIRLIDQIYHIVSNTNADYIYLLNGNDSLTVDALLKYVLCIEEKQEPDLIFANEAVQYSRNRKWLKYNIKPLFSHISIFQSLFIGEAIIWKCDLLKAILKDAQYEQLNLLQKELLMLSLKKDANIVQLPDSLLIKETEEEEFDPDAYILSLLHNNVTHFTNWKGRIGLTSSYGKGNFELYSDELKPLSQTGFLIIEDNLDRLLQLLSQVGLFFCNNEIIVGAYKDSKEKVYETCCRYGFSNVRIVLREQSYVTTIYKMIDMMESSYHLILNDLVQWINYINLERLMNSFLKPEVMVAVPQVASEGENPILVYAGAGINNITLNGAYFEGRLQQYQGVKDTAWMNYEVSMLPFYCIAVRKDLWKKVLPMHKTVMNAKHFANELSFLCLRKNYICEYCAQSSVWVKDIVARYNKKDWTFNEVILEDLQDETFMSGNYWHLLKEYGDLIEAREKDIPFLLRGYATYLKEEFQAYGLSNIKEIHKKRVLVLTHELSLTGAPLVLVQAVKVLQEANFDVLIVSPEDGPLRESYLQMKIPVIIDPQLMHNLGFIRVAFDFNFVFVSTVVLWQCIEALGKTKLPVLWWVHDSRIGYENNLRYVLPETIGENILLYCGGDYAKNVITEFRPQYASSILLYGVEDFSQKIAGTVTREDWNLPQDKMIFANIGQITQRKGQDILAEAIRTLPEHVRKECAFVFVGTALDRNVYRKIKNLQKDYPESVFVIEQMPYNLLKEFYREIDGVICSSIDDPLPAFVTEAMLMSRICICSTNTAFRSIITSGENGYLFESGNAMELGRVISQAVNDEANLDKIKTNARKLYERTFTPELFQKNLINIISEKIMKS